MGLSSWYAGMMATVAYTYWWFRFILLALCFVGMGGAAYFQRELAKGIANGDAQLKACDSIPGFKRAQSNVLCKVVFRSKLQQFKDGKQKVADAKILLYQARGVILVLGYVALVLAQNIFW